MMFLSTNSCVAFLAALMLGTLLPKVVQAQRGKYLLSPEQLEWQGYQEGEVLRFGNQNNNYVRIYQVKKIKTRMRTDGEPSQPGFDPKMHQSMTVLVQRTDSVSKPFEAVVLELRSARDENEDSYLETYCEWDGLYGGGLPLDKVLKNEKKVKEYQMGIIHGGAGPDTLAYRSAELLPSATLGGRTHNQVIHIANLLRKNQAAGSRKTILNLYYACQLGVVGFEEKGTGLWYRLP